MYTCRASHDNTLENQILCVRDDAPANSSPSTSGDSKSEKPTLGLVDSKVEAPTGVAGFEFGTAPETAEAACAAAGFSWKKLDKRHAECSGAPVAISVASVPRLRFCGEKLCMIQLDIEREATAGLGSAFTGLYEAVQTKYGAKTGGSMTIAPSCRKGDFRECIVGGQVRIDVSWRWGSGESIALFTGDSRIGPELAPGGIYLLYVNGRPKVQTQGL